MATYGKYLNEIIDVMGGADADDELYTTKLDAIIELLKAGGGGGSEWKEINIPFSIVCQVQQSETYCDGKQVIMGLLFGSGGGANKGTTFATIPEGYKPKRTINVVGTMGETTQIFTINTDGTIKCKTSSVAGGVTIVSINANWII